MQRLFSVLLEDAICMNLTLPEHVDALLSKLRSAIRRYLLLRGLAIFFTSLVLVFWISLAIESSWFSITKLELPSSVRLAIITFGLAVLLLVLFQTIIWQLLVRLKRRALALLLEKRFPELNDRLITAVETAEQAAQHRSDPGLTHAMLARTLEETEKLTDSLDVKDVFNTRPIKRAGFLAVASLLSIAATAVASPETFSHWSNAYVKLAEDYWNRVNGLNAYLIAQPGDRIREFENHLCKHAAGADLTILVETQPGKQTPRQVLLSYKTDGGARGRAVMSPAGDGKFRHTIGNLVDHLEFTITGGDYTSPTPYRVVSVPEPHLESLEAVCEYPDYTNWNSPGVGQENRFPISSSEISVPMETAILLKARATKPVVEMKITGRNFELDIKKDAESGLCTGLCKFIDERGMTARQTYLSETASKLIDETGYEISIPFFVTKRYNVENDPSPEVFSNIPIDSGESLRIYLEDSDGIINLEPGRLQIIGIADQPPEVQTRLSGIGKAITRKAFLPVAGEVLDDYGIAEVHFEYRLNQENTTRKVPVERQPAGNRTFAMNGSSQAPRAKFDVLPLDLKLDDILYVALVASDKDILNGPNVTRGETYRLKIVSDEELLSILHQDELNLRRRFEQIIEELTRSRDDLHDAREKDEKLLADSVQRTLNTVQKDKVETDAVRAAFESLQEEMVNNRIDTPQVRRRLEGSIIQPLARIINEDFAKTEENLRLLDFSFRDHSRSTVTPAQAVAEMDRLLANLRQVLQAMRKLEDFQEVIELLKAIIADEKELQKKTEAERKKKLIDLLN